MPSDGDAAEGGADAGVAVPVGSGVSPPDPVRRGEERRPPRQATIRTEDARHIFRGARSHLQHDTPQNRRLLLDTALPEHYRGPDRVGTEIYTRTLPDGRQVWIYVRGNLIRNGGINASPWDYIPGVGLVPP